VILFDVLGFVAAPFPFITGVHTSYYENLDKTVCEEAAKVFLDENRIDDGSLGAPPTIPDRRRKKLLAEIVSAGNVFDQRGANWNEDRRPLFDDAFSKVSEQPATSLMNKKAIDEALRSAFLKFFVVILRNYRK
jgi:hypothetical protein